MSYKIIGDSCFDITKEDRKSGRFQIIPLTLQVDNHFFVDDETFNQAEFLKIVRESQVCPKSACPAPDAFLEAYKEAKEDMIFVVTISQHLSGTYNSAVLAKKMYEEEFGKHGKQIAVFSSDSASVGESQIGFHIQKLAEAGESFSSIVEKASSFIKNMTTFFVLETLDYLRKNGRLTGLQAFFASALNIKPVMGAENGTIVKRDQARGINKALLRMTALIVSNVKDAKNRTLSIAHCNCRERAEYIRDLITEKVKFKSVYITETAGVASLYANDGGIIIAY